MARVSLRKYTTSDYQLAFQIRGLTEPEQQEKFIKRMECSGQWDDHYLHYAVEHNGTLVGDLQLRRCERSMPPGSIEIGLDIDPQLRGQGLGTATLQAASELMFAQDVHRISGSTPESNLAMQRAFTKAQWRFEGVIRALFLEDARPIDYLSYSVTKFD